MPEFNKTFLGRKPLQSDRSHELEYIFHSLKYLQCPVCYQDPPCGLEILNNSVPCKNIKKFHFKMFSWRSLPCIQWERYPWNIKYKFNSTFWYLPALSFNISVFCHVTSVLLRALYSVTSQTTLLQKCTDFDCNKKNIWKKIANKSIRQYINSIHPILWFAPLETSGWTWSTRHCFEWSYTKVRSRHNTSSVASQ